MSKELTKVDKALAAQIRTRRIAIGKNQEDVAEDIGVSFQQFQKYEGGLNRISVGRMVAIALSLRLDPVDLLKKVI